MRLLLLPFALAMDCGPVVGDGEARGPVHLGSSRAPSINCRELVARFLFLLFPFVLANTVLSQTAPLVIAWQAPNLTSSCGGGSAGSCMANFVSNVMPHVSGIGVIVHWADIDSGCSSGANGTQCSTQSATCSTMATDFKFCNLDTLLSTYIGEPGWGSKKIVLIVWPTNDPPANSSTPSYVFSQYWANNLPGGTCTTGCPTQDVVACSGYPGNISGGTCPVKLTGTLGTSDYAVWNTTGISGNGNCLTTFNGNTSPDLACTLTCATPNVSGLPIVYEQPFMTAYQKFLAALALRYGPNSPVAAGKTIAPYIAYVRVGMSEGGENQPFCATSGRIAQNSWSPSVALPAGYLVNSSGTQYIATGGGTTGASMPTCSPDGCTTAPDGGIPGWYRAGSYSQSGTLTNSIWPGPQGMVSENSQYTDNGYLTTWASPADGTGYIASMMTFLKSLNASFPFTISSHNGPPADLNTAYADSEAITTSASNIGFGMESVSIRDSSTLATGIYPTSSQDWVYNFKAHPAPVHPLQTNYPSSPNIVTGNSYFAAGYTISAIAVSGGIATITCTTDCSTYSGLSIYVMGNSNPSLNGIWPVKCTNGTGAECLTDTLQFSSSAGAGGTGGTVWAPDYLSILLPFAVQHGATSIEVYECDLDYAYGTFSGGAGTAPTNPTTQWVPDEMSGNGCAEWGIQPSDAGYPNAIVDTLIGQPSTTSVRTGTSTLNNAMQY